MAAAVPASASPIRKYYNAFRFCLQTVHSLDYLAHKMGFTRTVIVEMAVQQLAAREGYKKEGDTK